MYTKIFRHSRILIGGFLSLSTLAIMNSAYSYLLDSIKSELTLSYTQSGALMSAYFLGYTVGQIPWGILADKYGSKKIMAVSVLGVSLSTCVFGLSSSFITAIISRSLSGLLGAGVFVPSVRLIAGWYDSNERGTALGILNIGGSVGLVLVTWASPLLASSYGWRLSIIIQGVAGLFCSILIWLTLDDGKIVKTTSENNIYKALKLKEFWILALFQFLRLGSYYTFLAWLPLILKESYGLDVIIVGAVMSTFSIAGMASNPIGGLFADKFGEKKVLFLSFLLLAINVFVLTLPLESIYLFFALFILGWLINFVRSPAFTIIPRMFGTEVAGSLSGIHNTFASIGALSLPLFLGLVKDLTFSYSMGWFTLSAMIIAVTALLITLNMSK